MIKLLLTIVITLMAASAPKAEVLFSDDFEWGADWNSSMTSVVPVSNGWGGVLVTQPGGDFENIYVNSVGAKNGSRGLVQYWDSDTSDSQESWLTQDPISGWSFPDEYYIGYWEKIDPNWDWGGATSLKLWKVNYTSADTTWDIGWLSSFVMACGDSWCNVDGTNWTGDDNCEGVIHTDEDVAEVFGCWSDVADGEWHYFVWHMDHSGEVIELHIDGDDATQMSPTDQSYGLPYTGGVGTSRFNFGGNLSGEGGGYDEMYTAHDDLIVATTEEEVLSFLGVGVSASRNFCGNWK